MPEEDEKEEHGKGGRGRCNATRFNEIRSFYYGRTIRNANLAPGRRGGFVNETACESVKNVFLTRLIEKGARGF